MSTDRSHDWDKTWAEVNTTITEQDVWLLTDRIKFRYLSRLVPSGVNSLEVGCGSAKLSALLAAQGAKIVGLDLSAEALRAARDNFSWLRIYGDLVRGDAFHLPFANERFDVVLSTGLFEHFQDPVPLVAEMVRILRPGGLFFSDIAPLKFSLLRMGYFLRGYHKQQSDEYPYSSRDIRAWLEKCDLQNIRVLSSGVVPPLGLLRRIPFARSLSFRAERLWTIFDGTIISKWLGFFYLAFATKAG
ncbi:MAG: class I SAM-dependent methyltransferase [Anaerolineae bacterium]|nr:class I SAM-dependent methyltransferase [Anaerolineae bacterium]